MWLLPITFPTVVAFGRMMGLMDANLPGSEVSIALGLMVLREAKPNLWRASLLKFGRAIRRI